MCWCTCLRLLSKSHCEAATGQPTVPASAPASTPQYSPAPWEQAKASHVLVPEQQPPNPRPTTFQSAPVAAQRPSAAGQRQIGTFAIRPKMSKAAQLAQSQGLQRPGPAFLKVPDRQQPEAPAPVPPPPAPAAAAGGRETWPAALRDWVRRAFDECREADKSGLHEVLKKIITEAQEKGELWSRDWASVPLPGSLPIKEPPWVPYGKRFAPS
jgi:hypothetical protein